MKAKERAFLTIDDWGCVVGLYLHQRKALEKRVTQAILDARQEAIEDCAVLVEQACLSTDKQMQEWRKRESTKRLGDLEPDDASAFCHADLCANKIRAIGKRKE